MLLLLHLVGSHIFAAIAIPANKLAFKKIVFDHLLALVESMTTRNGFFLLLLFLNDVVNSKVTSYTDIRV